MGALKGKGRASVVIKCHRRLRNSIFESLRCTNVTNMFFGPFALN